MKIETFLNWYYFKNRIDNVVVTDFKKHTNTVKINNIFLHNQSKCNIKLLIHKIILIFKISKI